MITIEDILKEGQLAVYSGAVFSFQKKGWIAPLTTYCGVRLYDANRDSGQVRSNTLFDIASLTKLLVFLTFHRLVGHGMVNFDETVIKKVFFEKTQRYIAGMTYRHLLTYVVDFEMPDDIRRFFQEAKLRKAPGVNFRYSNLPALIVGRAIESITKMPLDEAVRVYLLEPLGMKNTMYAQNLTAEHKQRVVQTQSVVNGKINHYGFPQDPMTLALWPKVVGISGVFSTISDMLMLAECLASNRTARGETFLLPQLYHQLISNQLEGIRFPDGYHRYGLGIDKFDLKYLNRFPNFCKDAVVMTGSTGPMIFSKPGKMWGVFLCNARPSIKDALGKKPIQYLRKHLLASTLGEK